MGYLKIFKGIRCGSADLVESHRSTVPAGMQARMRAISSLRSTGPASMAGLDNCILVRRGRQWNRVLQIREHPTVPLGVCLFVHCPYDVGPAPGPKPGSDFRVKQAFRCEEPCWLPFKPVVSVDRS